MFVDQWWLTVVKDFNGRAAGAAGAILKELKVHRGRVFLGGNEENNGAILFSSCVSQTVDNHFPQPQTNSQSLNFPVKTLKYHLKKPSAFTPHEG